VQRVRHCCAEQGFVRDTTFAVETSLLTRRHSRSSAPDGRSRRQRLVLSLVAPHPARTPGASNCAACPLAFKWILIP
jgi:hypothetical protein